MGWVLLAGGYIETAVCVSDCHITNHPQNDSKQYPFGSTYESVVSGWFSFRLGSILSDSRKREFIEETVGIRRTIRVGRTWSGE